ncbi:MAG: L,D-transpeptidase [Leptolyngbyaceae cyanobacterium HOT.MB2.61]|nr:L,D-transpeptidase [Leptolyngbyaceae cyanobacterium HOT.MB2.61]
MFLFLGASLVLLVIQWRAGAENSRNRPEEKLVPKSGNERVVRQEVAGIRREVAAIQSSERPNIPDSQSPATTTQPLADESQGVSSGAGVEGETNLVVDLSDRRVYLYQGKKLKTSYPLAVGQEGWETPTGSFEVIEMQKDPKWLHPITKEVVLPGPNNPLGKRWIGFWSDGKTHLGFHGTNQEDLIGQAVSHGCLRMRNKDVIALYNQVSEGTPVKVRH